MTTDAFDDRLQRALGCAISEALALSGVDLSRRPTYRVIVAFDDDDGRTEIEVSHSFVDPPVPAPPSPYPPEAA